MTKSEKWFRDVFLPSFDEKFQATIGTKYEGQLIVSEKQAQICYRNMNTINCYGDYGNFSRYRYIIKEEFPNDAYSTRINKTSWEIERRGKYYFLHKWTEEYTNHHHWNFDDDEE